MKIGMNFNISIPLSKKTTLLRSDNLRSAFVARSFGHKDKTMTKRQRPAGCRRHKLHLRHHQQWQEANKHPAAASLQETSATYESSPQQALPKMSKGLRKLFDRQLNITTPHFVPHSKPSSLMTRRMLLFMRS